MRGFSFSTHDPAGSLVVVNTKQPFITLTLTWVLISNPACCSQYVERKITIVVSTKLAVVGN
jgi:hypothetical protein